MGSLGGFLVWGGGFPAISSKRVELGFEPRSVSTAHALNPFPVCVVQAPRLGAAGWGRGVSLPSLGSQPHSRTSPQGQREPGRAVGQGHAARVVLGLEVEMGVPVSRPSAWGQACG